jgi:lysophospholipase L1-like esterase
MRSTLFILFCLLQLACKKPASPAAVYTGAGGNTGPLKTWLALGDSYTIGQSVASADRFATQTANLLKLAGVNIGEPDYIATTGFTTTNLANAIAAQNPAKHDVVSLLIGVNDQYQTHDTSGYRQRFTSLLAKAIQLANGKTSNVFVLSIPDYSVTPFAAGTDTAQIRKELDWFNAINQQVTQSYGIAWLDITPGTRLAKTNTALLVYDGLHPSKIEYKNWADRLAPMMLPVLK